MATQTHLETLTLSRSSGVTFAECGRRVNMMRCTSLLSDITCIACRRHGLQRLADNDLPRPVVKRKGGRRHADRCEGCGHQARVARLADAARKLTCWQNALRRKFRCDKA